ncbi:hypothetical protein JTE90_025973 [Oedothorax gibbosus]|uniref:Tyrosine-protein kinase n=1 Tax=Oedothorax gibbosus TaxID=931172 RepID=A0AAV6U7Z9_9ARAC|nr:hypothetical protein JTE90_025973 [Oedothorax gibbosus]
MGNKFGYRPSSIKRQAENDKLKNLKIYNIIQENKENKNNFRERKESKTALALYSLQIESKSVLKFHKGDRLIVEDDSDPNWCVVRHINQETRGYAPCTFLSFDPVLGGEKWYFGDILREDAEHLLLLRENKVGTFLIRNSHIPDTYALSLKNIDSATKKMFIIHYKIRCKENEGGYFISPNHVFDSIKELVEHYSDPANCVGRNLVVPCPRPRPKLPGPLPDFQDEYEISFKSLKFIKCLGKGNFGEVFYGTWNDTCEVAIKRLSSNGVQSDDFRREVAVMKTINHPKIVRLYAICTEREPFCIVMEYLCNGNLQEYLRSSRGKLLKLPSLVNMAAQIADGMNYLDSKNLIHRDLAARNILVGDNGIVKLADFGLARIIDDAVYFTKGGKIPLKWTAPEAYTSGQFTIKSDVWSFGIVLYEIFTHGELPYHGMMNQQVLELVTQHNYRMPRPKDPECSYLVYEKMRECWNQKPEERPTFEYLYNYFIDYYKKCFEMYDSLESVRK